MNTRLKALPAALDTATKDITAYNTTVSEAATRVQALQADVNILQKFGHDTKTVLPPHIWQDLQAILVNNALEAAGIPPLLITGTAKKNPTPPLLLAGTAKKNPTPPFLLTDGKRQQKHKNQITLFGGNIVALGLTQEQQSTLIDFQKNFVEQTPLTVQRFALISNIKGYLSTKEKELEGAKTILENAKEKLVSAENTKKTLQQQKKDIQTNKKPQAISAIPAIKKSVRDLAKTFQGKIAWKKKQLLNMKLDGKPFSATEYYLMGDSLILCTLVIGTTGPFPLFDLFDAVFIEFLFEASAILGLVVKTFLQGNVTTMGKLLMDTFRITMVLGVFPMPDPSKWSKTHSFDEIMYLGILVIVSVLLIGNHCVEWFLNTFGFTRRAYQNEIRRLKDELQAKNEQNRKLRAEAQVYAQR